MRPLCRDVPRCRANPSRSRPNAGRPPRGFGARAVGYGGAVAGWRAAVQDRRPEPAVRAGLSTTDLEDPASRQRVGLWVRRGFLTLLLVLVVAGLFDLLGVRGAVATAGVPPGPVLRVEYPQVARAGLDAPFEIDVSGVPAGAPVRIAVSGTYLDLFDRSAIDPRPETESWLTDSVVWTYRMPATGSLQVSVGAAVQSGRHFGTSGEVALLDDQGSPLAQAHIKTWLAP